MIEEYKFLNYPFEKFLLFKDQAPREYPKRNFLINGIKMNPAEPIGTIYVEYDEYGNTKLSKSLNVLANFF